MDRLGADPKLFAFFDEAGLDGIWCLNLENMKDEWYSPKFKAVLGYEPHEVPDTSSWWREHIHPDDLPGLLERFERHLADPATPYDQIVRYRHREGHWVTIRCRGIMLRNEDGEATRMLGTHTDVSAIRDSENALRRANETLKAFAATVSHDLKAPLRHVGVLASLASSKLDAGAQSDAQELLALLQDTSHRAMGIVDGLLRLSEIQRYEADLDASADLQECVSYAASSAATGEAKVEIADLPCVAGDAGLLTTLFTNLITNSVKYTAAARPVVQVRFLSTSDDLIIEVDDNGPGIPASESERIFQPLERGRSAQDIDGHGLGLAVCRAIANAHGGELALGRSQLGGACLELRLPASRLLSQTAPIKAAHRG